MHPVRIASQPLAACGWPLFSSPFPLGKRQRVRLDHSARMAAAGVTTCLTELGGSCKNPFNESFNGKLGDDVLPQEKFYPLRKGAY